MVGQGATEYLVLLAVVLVIALVSISLLGFFPGTASDTRMAQSKSYWESQSPIGIVDGVSTSDGTYFDHDSVILTLRNNAAYPVELIAIRYGPKSSDPDACNSHGYATLTDTPEFGNICDGYFYQYFSPGASRDAPYYSAYIAPPRGHGWGVGSGDMPQYSQINILQPGEMITVGFQTVGSAALPGYPTRLCSDRTGIGYATGNTFEMNDFRIVYASIKGGHKTVKREVGTSPLILPCTTEYSW